MAFRDSLILHDLGHTCKGTGHLSPCYLTFKTDSNIIQVLVLYNSSGNTSTSRGVVIAGAPEVELKKTMVVGPWQVSAASYDCVKVSFAEGEETVV